MYGPKKMKKIKPMRNMGKMAKPQMNADDKMREAMDRGIQRGMKNFRVR